MIKRICYLFLRFIKLVLTKFINPVVHGKVNGIKIQCDLSHEYALRSVAGYELLIRLSKYISRTTKLNMVDVGAHIGACSVSVYKEINNGAFLCIEGNVEFLKHCEYNIRQIPFVILEKCFVGEENATQRVHINTNASTGNITPDKDGKFVELFKIDSILIKNGFEVNLLKIDCDGYDFKALRGAAETLSKHKPVLFFEYSPIHQILHKVETDPSQIWNFLYDHGYLHYFIYNPNGTLMFKASFNDLCLLKQLDKFALASITHFDVLSFHSEDMIKQEEFFSCEQQFYDSIIEQQWGERWVSRLK